MSPFDEHSRTDMKPTHVQTMWFNWQIMRQLSRKRPNDRGRFRRGGGLFGEKMVAYIENH